MNCVKCKNEINPLRLKALPNTKVCVDCSDMKPKRVQTRLYGEKEDTWNDIEFVEDDE